MLRRVPSMYLYRYQRLISATSFAVHTKNDMKLHMNINKTRNFQFGNSSLIIHVLIISFFSIHTMSTPAFTIHTSFSPLISLYDAFLLDQFGGEWLFAMMCTSCASSYLCCCYCVLRVYYFILVVHHTITWLYWLFILSLLYYYIIYTNISSLHGINVIYRLYNIFSNPQWFRGTLRIKTMYTNTNK